MVRIVSSDRDPNPESRGDFDARLLFRVRVSWRGLKIASCESQAGTVHSIALYA